MSLDVDRLVGAVDRKLTTREDGARVVTATRVYETPREDLWDAITNPERIPRWFMPISGELRPGGRYQLEGNAGGEILTCEEPSLLKVTWEMHGQVSWVNVALEKESPERTRLRLEHIAHVPDDMWDEFGPGAVGVGWDLALFGLHQHFAPGGPAVRPDEAEAWMISDEGRAFSRAASDAWGEASVAGGTDPTAAREAAERTTVFYTGQSGGQG